VLSARLLTATLLTMALAACNTTDALTPQADVGGGMARSSSPVTQAEADRMAGAGGSVPSVGRRGSGSYATGPQNTLEAQARALEAGNTVSPASSGPPPDWQGQGDAGQQDGNAPGTGLSAEAGPSPTETAGRQAALQPASGTIRFLPIIGAPVQAVTPLSRQLGASARAGGLTIRPSSDTSTEQILKGYFSAFADSGNVTVVYVWDILDNSGARLHRMQGQDTVPGQGSDPWAAVPASLMQSIATKTIGDYIAWRQAQSG
jgi:hypothetical protein